MQTREIKKLYNGYASLRDYEIKKFKEGVILTYQGKKMTLPPEKLKNSFHFHEKTIQSKFGGTYKLIDFRFIPDEDNNQLELL
jgi:hypothetical protein